MTVHMVWLRTEPPRNAAHFTKLQAACDTWTASYSETLLTHSLDITHVAADDGMPEHTTGWWRFEMTTDATTLLADLEAALQAEVAWYKIKYHRCSHDEAAPGGCTFDETQTREYGTVPAGIP